MLVRNRILAEATIIALQIFLLLALTATLGVDRGEQPIAAEEALVERDQNGRYLQDREAY